MVLVMKSAERLSGPLTYAEQHVIAQATHLVEANFSRGDAPLTLDLSDDRTAVRDEIVRRLHAVNWSYDISSPIVVVSRRRAKMS
jgi:hypothetical protein